MRIRKGDRVKYLSGEPGNALSTAMVCRVRGFPLDKYTIGVRHPHCTLMEIIHKGDVAEVVERRDTIHEWWRYL